MGGQLDRGVNNTTSVCTEHTTSGLARPAGPGRKQAVRASAKVASYPVLYIYCCYRIESCTRSWIHEGAGLMDGTGSDGIKIDTTHLWLLCSSLSLLLSP
jgi:hypothetical protein